MALAAATVWEIRSTGASTNGGGFVAGAAGTDYSQQNAAQVAVTDVVGNGTTLITSATANFSSLHVGNIIYLQGGSGSLAATRRQVVSITNATSIVVDASVATGTGITLNLGGCLDHPSTLAGTNYVAGNVAWLKASATYTTTATITFSTGQASPTNNAMPCRLIGYTTTRGDNGKSTIQLSTTTSISIVTFSGSGWWADNIIFDANGLSGSISCTASGNYHRFNNCIFKNFGSTGLSANNNTNHVVSNCEVFTSNSAVAGINCGSTSHIWGNWIHDSTLQFALVCGLSNAHHNIISNIPTGVGLNPNTGGNYQYNTIYKCGSDGIKSSSSFNFGIVVLNNIFSENGGYGMNLFPAAGWFASVEYDGNAYYSNTSGTRNNCDDTTVNPQNGVSPYTNTKDVICSADPFVAKASNNYMLNNTAGGGAACRAVAQPTVYPNLAIVTNYSDMGALQHQDSGGSTQKSYTFVS